MSTYYVYEVQEEIRCRKWRHVVDAKDEQEAIDKVRAQESDPIDCGELGEPDYADSGFVVRSEDADEEGVWEEAVSDLAVRKSKDSSVNYIQQALDNVIAFERR